MSSVAETHSASGPFAGYLFQLDVALLWLARSPVGSVVGLETLDDIASVEPDGMVRIGQSKLSYTRNLYADGNRNFWKTLGIWLGLIAEDEVDPAKSEFYIISNFSVNSGIVFDLKNSTTKAAFRALAKKLKALASTVGSDCKAYAEIVNACAETTIVELLEKVRVSDGIPSHPDAQLPLFAASMNLPADMATVVIRGMRGWILEQAESAFAERKPAWVQKEQFSGELARLVAQNYDNQLVLRTAREIEVKPEDQESARNAVFVEQMRWIEAESDEILEAIDDYFRSIDERTRLADENDVSRREFDAFEGRLVDRWKGLHRACADTCTESKRAGRNALRKTLDHREELAGQPTSEFYLTRGTYHQLANGASASVGWHPEFRKLLKRL